MAAAIEAEQKRVDTLDSAITTSGDEKDKISLIADFDDGYPLFRNYTISENLDLGAISTQSEIANVLSRGRGLGDDAPLKLTRFVQTERQTLTESLQSASSENKDILNRQENLLKKIQHYASSLSRGPKLPHLDSLPEQFSVIIGIRPLNFRFPLSAQETQSSLAKVSDAIAKYREALQDAKVEAPISLSPDSIVAEKKEILGEADAIASELKSRDTSQKSLIDKLEREILVSAKSIYGSAIGTDSFTYLLIVFALIFGVIMVVPRMYPETVASNILKAEFLLQFSTVFVLIAAIIILGIGKLIQQDQVPVLLAGISGYVLGQLGKA